MRSQGPDFSCATRRVAAAAALLSLSLPLFPQETPTTRSALAEIVETRDRCAEYAAIARRELKGDRLVRARGLYIEAYSSNSAWVATVKAAIREGTAKRLDTDRIYERVSSKAATTAGLRGARAGTVGYGAPVPAVLILATPLADIGIKLWKAHREKLAAERQVASDGFGKDAAWKPWEEAAAGGRGF